MPKPPAAIKLRLRRMSCNGLDVLPFGTQVLFTCLSDGPVLPFEQQLGGSNPSLKMDVDITGARKEGSNERGVSLLTGKIIPVLGTKWLTY
jgi:hypothetical protein